MWDVNRPGHQGLDCRCQITKLVAMTSVRTARARIPRRKRLGLVLSGGGSRGVAHIGVIRALLEAGIEPDPVAGASAGAIVGALYAAGHSPAAMLDFFRGLDPLPFNGFALGKPGLLDPMTFAPYFRRYFRGDSFARLQRKLFIVATDLIRGEPVVFTRGRLIRPLLASSAVPMVYSPIQIGGRWYGDGGIVDNLPVRLLEGRCDITIGVYASPIRRVRRRELSNSFSVLDRALEVGILVHSRASFARCDLVIQPRALTRYGMFDTEHLPAIEAVGYRAARDQMPRIRRLLRR